MFTIDASVWICSELPYEVEHRSSRAFLDQVAQASAQIVVPTLLLVEAAAAISRVRRSGPLALRYSAQLLAIPTAQWIELDAKVAQEALKIAATHALRGADSVYAAVALAQGCELVTLDKEVLRKLRDVMSVHTPRDALSHHWQISI